MQHHEELKTLIKHFNLIKSNKSCSKRATLIFLFDFKKIKQRIRKLSLCFIFLSLCDKKSKSKILSLQLK